MAARIQITMDPEMRRQAHAKASQLGISLAEYVRRLVARDLGNRKRKADISVLFDLGASREPTDVARDKDAMLGQAMWDEYCRKTSRPRQRKL
jgi:hypothetical protein